MADSKDRAIAHLFDGGFASDQGTLANAAVENDGKLRVPFLLSATNVVYDLDGAVKKIGGTSKYNSSAIEGGEEIRGMFEYIKMGATGLPVRKRVVHAGTKIKNDANDGTFVDLFTGLQNDAVPSYTVFEDLLIIASDNTADAPRSWDQTTAQLLAGSPPRFSFSCVHANRLWAAGDFANPSRVYYSELLDPTIWSGGTSGHIDVDPSDGDMVTGLASYLGNLVIFKGPNAGSIHRITGLEPSAFARQRIYDGTGNSWHNTIFPFRGNLGFVDSSGMIRALSPSDRYGDFGVTEISTAISSWIRDNVVKSQLRRAWAATDHIRGYTLITLPTSGSATPDKQLYIDHRFRETRFAVHNAVSSWSVSYMSDPSNNNQSIIYLGGNDGYVRKTQRTAKSIDTTSAINASFRMPYLNYSTPHRWKTLQHFGMGIRSTGSSDVLVMARSEQGSDSETLSLSGGDVLGPSAINPFTLDVSQLAGSEHVTSWGELTDLGQFRSVSYEFSNNTISQDLDIQVFYAVMETAQSPGYENSGGDV